jgi:hypothetical protein
MCLDCISKLVDNYNVVSGGMGFGLGSLLECPSVNYDKKSKLGFTVYPSLRSLPWWLSHKTMYCPPTPSLAH